MEMTLDEVIECLSRDSCIGCKYHKTDESCLETAVDTAVDILKRVKMEQIKCINCESFSDKEYYSDNTVYVHVDAYGSCKKCTRNIDCVDPEERSPSRCPKKKEEHT